MQRLQRTVRPTDGEYVLKYFLVNKAKKHNGTDLHMNHPPKASVEAAFSAKPSLAESVIALGRTNAGVWAEP